jgi:hypothetical protein
MWFNAGKQGAGPLTVPMPAKATAPTPAPRVTPVQPIPMDDFYIGDPVGKDLGLPPKMTAPAVTFP